MRQVCNLVVAVNAEILTEEGQFDRWLMNIERPPADYFNKRDFRPRSSVAPELDALMRQGG